MGSELTLPDDGPLQIEIEVHGTGQLAFVELARYDFDAGVWDRAFFQDFQNPDGYSEKGLPPELDFANTFELPCASDSLYYLRVMQQALIDGWPGFAWSSPIWVTRG
jgi:hypothetical protein